MADDGDTFHGDHGYAQYYIPPKPRKYPLIMWHGMGQSGKCFESTPDGRDGFQMIFAQRDWSVYIIDQARWGRAGRTQAKPADPPPEILTKEHAVWNMFRLGVWTPPGKASFFPGIQFPQEQYAIDQLFRQEIPEGGGSPWTYDYRVFMGKTMAKLFEATDGGILITHSNSGQYGWHTAIEAPDLVKAIVAFEPGAFVFPEGEAPPPIPDGGDPQNIFANEPLMVSQNEFAKIVKVPILIIMGDNIPTEPSEVFELDFWRMCNIRTGQFVEAVNRHGGDVRLVYLPKIGIKGNTHFAFSDLNNIQIANLVESYLREKRLDRRKTHHRGPYRMEKGKGIPFIKSRQ